MMNRLGYIFATVFALLVGGFIIGAGRAAFETGSTWAWGIFIGMTVMIIGAALLLPDARDREP
jgi:hypothetical protein